MRHFLTQVLMLVCVALTPTGFAANQSSLFQDQSFTDSDSILVLDETGQSIFSWQASVPRTPASVIKLLTTWLALQKWGEDHQFETRFFELDGELWVQGSGDPMLISEELDKIVIELDKVLTERPTTICLDSTLFADPPVPGRGKTDDPYNAPLSALAVNFNTVSLKKVQGRLMTGEPQTPLTPLARQLRLRQKLTSRPTRLNLKDASRAQQQFGEVLAHKLGVDATIRVNQSLPAAAREVLTHRSSYRLTDVLRGTLEYSNNFIANQLFLMLGEPSSTGELNFNAAQRAAASWIEDHFNWQNYSVVDGAGLSRDNRLSAVQVAEVLNAVADWKHLLKTYDLQSKTGGKLLARAKSGTLTGVHSLAGFLQINDREYRFVFLFDRVMPYRFRESLLQSLAEQLSARVP